MKFKTSCSCETIKCVHELILSQFVLVFILVNMGLECSSLRSRFDRYRLVGRNITMPPSKIHLLREKFCDLPGSMLDKLKSPYSELFLEEVHWGRLLVFLHFADQVDLTEEEWVQLFDFLVPILIRIGA